MALVNKGLARSQERKSTEHASVSHNVQSGLASSTKYMSIRSRQREPKIHCISGLCMNSLRQGRLGVE